MKVIKFNGQTDNTPKTIMLGFFDCMHLGHKKLLQTAKQLGLAVAVFTFDNALQTKQSVVYTFSERLQLFKELGIDYVLFATFDNEFANTSASDFLNSLKNNFNMAACVSGYDYKFGKDAKANTSFLENFCCQNNIVCKVCPKQEFMGQKASSTLVKTFLLNGQIDLANKLLDGNFFISSKVLHGRKVGGSIGFPTANLNYPQEKAQLKYGVYAGYGTICGKMYKAVINYGAKPTFDVKSATIEVHFIGFTGSLYGKEITVYISKRLRDITRFNSVNELICQIKKDTEQV